MKNILIITVVAFASCTTTRKTTESQTVHTESAQLINHAERATGNTIISETRDTAIGVQERQVHDSVPSQLLVASGQWSVGGGRLSVDSGRLSVDGGRLSGIFKKIPIHKEKSVNGLKAWVLIDTNGTIHYGAKSDSFTLLVKKLQYQRDSVYSQVQQAQFIEAITKDSHETTTEKAQSTSGFSLLLVGLFFLAVGLFAFTINQSGKRWIR